MAKGGDAYIPIKPDMSEFKKELQAALAKINVTLKIALKPDMVKFKAELQKDLAKLHPSVTVDVKTDPAATAKAAAAIRRVNEREAVKTANAVRSIQAKSASQEERDAERHAQRIRDIAGRTAIIAGKQALKAGADIEKAAKQAAAAVAREAARAEKAAVDSTQRAVREAERASSQEIRVAQAKAAKVARLNFIVAAAIGRQHQKVAREAERAAAREIKAAERTAAAVARQSLRAARDVERAAALAARAAANAAKEAEKSGKAALKSISKFANGIITKLRPLTALIAVATTAIGPLIAVLNGAAAAATAMGAALGAAVAGGAAGLIGDFVALGQAMLVVKFASAGMGDAFKAQGKILADQRAGVKPAAADLKNLKVAMAGLSPAAKGFVTSWGKVSKSLDPVRKAVQQKLFAGLGGELEKTSKALLPTLQTELGRTAGVLNTTAKGFGAWLRQGETTKLIGSVMKSNTAAVSTMGSALTPLLDLMLRLGRAVAPLTQMLAEYFANWIKAKDASVKAGEKSGALAATVDKMKAALKTLLSIVGNVTGALKNTFSGGMATGQTLLGMLDRLTQKWEDWTASAEGKSAIAGFFETAIPTAKALGGLIGDIFKLWQDLSKQSDGPGFIEQLRGMVGPIGDLLKQLSGGDTFKNLAEAFTAIAKALADANAGGMIANTASDVSSLVKALAGIITSIPGGPAAIGALVKSLAALAALKFTLKVTGISKLAEMASKIPAVDRAIGGLKGKLGELSKKFANAAAEGAKAFGKKTVSGVSSLGSKLAGAATSAGKAALELGKVAAQQVVMAAKTVATNVAIAAQKTLQLAIAAATKAWAAVQGLINIAMSANPIGIIIIAIIALIAGIILLWKNSETFRAIVTGVWKAVADGAVWLWHLLVGVFTAVWDFIKSVWTGIVDAIVGAWNFVVGWFKKALDAYVSFWSGVWTGIWNTVKRIWDGIGDAIKAAWDWITKTVSTGVGNIVKFFKELPKKLFDAVGNLVDKFKTIGGDIIRGLWEGIKNLSGWLMDKVRDFILATVPGPILKVLGIDSPSKLMAKQVGKPIGQGIAVGMKATTRMLEKQALELSFAAMPPVPRIGFNTSGAFSATSGLSAALSSPQIRVFLGDRELTDLVRVEVDGRNEDMARAILNGRRI